MSIPTITVLTISTLSVVSKMIFEYSFEDILSLYTVAVRLPSLGIYRMVLHTDFVTSARYTKVHYTTVIWLSLVYFAVIAASLQFC